MVEKLPTSIATALDRLFAESPLASNTLVADFLNVSTKTLRRLGDQGAINWRPKGIRGRQYAREDVEEYLASNRPPSKRQKTWTIRVGRTAGSGSSRSHHQTEIEKLDFAAPQARELRKRQMAKDRKGK